MRWAGRQEFTRRVTPARTRPTQKRSTNYWRSLHEFAPRTRHVVLDFIVYWRWRTTARLSQCLKGLLRDKLPSDRAGRVDSDTIRFLLQMVSNEPLASLHLRKKIN